MKKYLKYELKKNLWTFVIITAILTVPYVMEAATMTMKSVHYGYNGYQEFVYRPNTATLFTMLVVLTFVMPILTYSFKMSKRGVDGYYGLPIKREKLFLVKTIVGLLLIFVPFTIAYWLGFFTVLTREGNPYYMAWYVPAYFGYLALGVLLFGFNGFVFTRANKAGDGVVFMLAYMLVGSLAFAYVETVFELTIPWWIEEGWYSFGALSHFDTVMADMICRGEITGNTSWWTYVYCVVTGGIGYALLFYTIRFEKAENAEQVSESWFGYRTLIPIYTALLIAASGGHLLSICFVSIAALIGMIVYQRKFKLPARCWITLGASIVLGLILGCFV